MLFGLSTTSKVALATVGAIFIVFSLVCSFVLPRMNPDFPGRKWRNPFLALCIAIFIAMMSTVVIYGKEEEEPAGAEAAAAEPGGTSSGESATAYENGDAAAGKTVFVSSGCGACHTLKAANATGTVGPNLDKTKSDEATIVDRVVNGKGAMTSFKERLTEKQIADVVAYVHESA